MSSSTKWYHIALIGGGAAGLGGLIYYLTREGTPEPVAKKGEPVKKDTLDVGTATKEQVLEVLERVIKSQETMKGVMKTLIQSLVETDLTFDEVYEKVLKVQPDDPLETTGLSMHEFDQLLSKFQDDPTITASIAKIMGVPGPLSCSSKVNSLNREKIVELHEFMLQEVKRLVENFQLSPKRQEYDIKTVTIAVQAIVGAKVEKAHGLTSEEIESAVLLHHQSLESDPDFARINVQIQSTMSDLMGSHFASNFCN